MKMVKAAKHTYREKWNKTDNCLPWSPIEAQGKTEKSHYRVL